MEKISVVIPTLQKNKELLFNLIESLNNDSNIDEIILIDNSTKGFELKSSDFSCKYDETQKNIENFDKLKVIIPKENIFVNPAWNLGVETAKNEIIALLNDDITIPDDFCSRVARKMTPEMGIVGIHCDFVKVIKNICEKPQKTDLFLKESKQRNMNFGIAMFFYKSAYEKIPDDIKIFWGDDWIFKNAQKQGRKNYSIKGQEIYHFGSLSTSSMGKNPIFKQDKNNYKKRMLKWHQFIFDFEKIYHGFRIRIFNIEITKHFGKNWE